MVSKTSQIKNYIVDLDGTLIHLLADWPAVREFTRSRFAEFGFAYDSSLGLDANLFAFRAKYPKEFLLLLDPISTMETRDLGSAPVNAGLVAELRDKNWALFTLNAGRTAKAVLQLPSFQSLKPGLIVAKEDVSEPKPSPDGVHRILRELKWQAGDTLYLGDSEKDECSARAAGVAFRRIVF